MENTPLTPEDKIIAWVITIAMVTVIGAVILDPILTHVTGLSMANSIYEHSVQDANGNDVKRK